MTSMQIWGAPSLTGTHNSAELVATNADLVPCFMPHHIDLAGIFLSCFFLFLNGL